VLALVGLITFVIGVLTVVLMDLDSPQEFSSGLGLFLFTLEFFGVSFNGASIGLGIAGFIQPTRARHFALVGLIISGSLCVLSLLGICGGSIMLLLDA